MLFFAAFIALFLILWGAVYAVLPSLWRGLMWISHHAARVSQRWSRVQRVVTYASRFRDYDPVVLIVLAGALGTALVGDSFLDLAELVHAKSTFLQQVDTRFHDLAVSERRADATAFFVTVTIIGGPAGVGVIYAIVAIVLIMRKRWRWLLYLTVTAGGGGLLNLELKRYFARARPAVAEMLRRAHGYSFPSGHAMGSTVVFGALAYIAFRASSRWRTKAAAIALALSLVLSVAASRVYLGVHWLSDVGAGMSAGAAWVTATTIAYETLRRIRGIRQLRGQDRTPRSSNRDGARGE